MHPFHFPLSFYRTALSENPDTKVSTSVENQANGGNHFRTILSAIYIMVNGGDQGDGNWANS
jgi:hypothetical protein